MNLSTLKHAPRSRDKRKRIGRGNGSGHGGTATKGHKGQKSRSGSKIKLGFEGGQMPLQRRIPKFGFTNLFKTEYRAVNVSQLSKLDVSKITPAVLFEKGLIPKKSSLVKILGAGDIEKSIEIEAHGFSRTALEKIEKAGGKITLLGKEPTTKRRN